MITVRPADAIRINKRFNRTKVSWVDRNLLGSAFSSFSYYDTDIEKICSIFRGLVKNHAFSDGNKRTASAILVSWLEQNGYSLLQEDLCDLVMDVATHSYGVSEIVALLKSELIRNVV